MYRAIKDNNSDTVIAIGMDESQSGPYHDVGIWCDFTFSEIPEIPQDVSEYMQDNKLSSVLKVVENTVVCKTLVELQQ